MALKTVRKQIEAVRKEHAKILKTIGKELRKAIVSELAEHIPKGWFLHWHQSDNQYNDENYYFGLDSEFLCSVKVPRQGKLLQEATPKKFEKRKDYYGREYDEWVSGGESAKYEWILDDECEEERDPDDFEWNEPGCISIREDDDDEHGLAPDFSELKEVFESLDDEDFRNAFGDSATVVIYANGKCTVDTEDEDE